VASGATGLLLLAAAGVSRGQALPAVVLAVLRFAMLEAVGLRRVQQA